MASVEDFPARGKVIGTTNGKVIFNPDNTNYQMHLETATPYTGPMNEPIRALISVKARKVYTVPSGGGFMSPIFGPPRTLQGRALYADDKNVVIRSGVPVVIELPVPDDAIDLEYGPIRAGAIVNVAASSGVLFKLFAATLQK